MSAANAGTVISNAVVANSDPPSVIAIIGSVHLPAAGSVISPGIKKLSEVVVVRSGTSGRTVEDDEMWLSTREVCAVGRNTKSGAYGLRSVDIRGKVIGSFGEL